MFRAMLLVETIFTSVGLFVLGFAVCATMLDAPPFHEMVQNEILAVGGVLLFIFGRFFRGIGIRSVLSKMKKLKEKAARKHSTLEQNSEDK